jgi:pimeloyl-ACP methyl ester carboxylesterase
VRSLVLISTSPATAGDRGLPPPSERFMRFAAQARVDWSDANSMVEHLVAYARVLGGPERPFDEVAARQLARRDVARARDFAAMQNHDLLAEGEHAAGPLSSITAPTLVIHGTADPMFPLEHAQALIAEIPGARLLPLPGAGHGVQHPDWPAVAAAIVDHTERG